MRIRTVLSVLALIAAAPRAEAALPQEIGQEFAVGKNIAGEECRLRLVAKRPEENDFRRYALFCRGWSQASGHIRRFSAQRFEPRYMVTESSWAKDFGSRYGGCGAPIDASAGEGRAPAAMRSCRRLDGDWPVVVFAARIDGIGYLAEGLPTNAAALDTAIAILAGKRPPEQAEQRSGPTADLVRRLETLVGTSATKIGVQDVAAVRELKDLGLHYNQLRSIAKSEGAYRRALEIVTRLIGPDAPANGDIWSHIALQQSWQGQFSAAEASLQKALPLVEKSVSYSDKRRWFSFKAQLEASRGNHEEALKFARQASALTREQQRRDAYGLAHALTFEAEELYNLGRYGEAVVVGRESVSLYEQARGLPTLTAMSSEWVGHALEAQKRFPEARAAFAKALELREAAFGDSTIAARTHLDIGRTLAAEGRSQEALAAYRRGIEGAARDAISTYVLSRQHYAPALDLLLAPGSNGAMHAEAFRAVQQARGNIASRAVSAMAARLASDDPKIAAVAREYQDSLDRQQRLRNQLVSLGAAEDDAVTDAREEQAKQELRSTAALSEKLEGKLQAEFPRYAELVRARSRSAEEVGKLLRPGEGLLYVVPTRDAAYVFLVASGGRISAHRAALPEKQLDTLVGKVRRSVEVSGSGLRKFAAEEAHDLYAALLRPLESSLGGIKHLVVVPSGTLLNLPLSLLLTQPPTDERQQPFLVRRMAVSVSPAIGNFVDLRRTGTRSPAPLPFVGFADPIFSGVAGDQRAAEKLNDAACRRGDAVDQALLRALPRLADTEDEVRAVAASLGAGPDTLFSQAKASEETLRGLDLSKYRVVYFATHGLLPQTLRCQNQPALALTPPAQPKGRNDGLLDAGEVAALKLNADWVVLSACDTAGPDGNLSGEALSGLARAFFYAGARSLMVSHWPVVSASTVKLATATFAGFAKNPDAGKAEALRRAQLALLDDATTAHPIHWAPFSLVGDGGGK